MIRADLPRFAPFSTFAAVALIFGPAPGSGGTDDPPAKAAPASKAEAAARQPAGRAAEAFLKLVDGGKYAESYDAASAWFRKGMTRRRWVESLTNSRRPMGRVTSRKLDRIEYRSLNAPDVLDQAWIYSNTRFDGADPCAELTVVFIEQGAWRMSGYFVGDPASFPKPSPARR